MFFLAGSAPHIDANKFKNLTFRMSVNGPRDVAAGSVARVFWRRTIDPSPQSSDDIIVEEGMNNYVFDMTTIVKEPGPGTPWGGTMKYLRVDPHEFPTQREFFIDDFKIAADDESNGRFAITWTAADADDDATISIFRDTDRTVSTARRSSRVSRRTTPATLTSGTRAVCRTAPTISTS